MSNIPQSLWKWNGWNEVAIRTHNENVAIWTKSFTCLYIICLHFLHIFLLKNLIQFMHELITNVWIFHFSANWCLFYNFFCWRPCIWSCVVLLQGSILLIGEYISYHVLLVSSMMMQCKQHTNCLFLFCRYQVLNRITWSRKSFRSLLCPEEKHNC